MADETGRTERERHLARRLEGFGDVVFGFAIAQLALQLDLPKTPAELYGHPVRYALYFGTFALLALLWLAFHRILSATYRPTRVDLMLTFAYLAFVGLVPYAMYANAHFAARSDSAAIGLATYLVCGFGTATTLATVSFRNAARGGGAADLDELRRQWRLGVAMSYFALVMFASVVVDLTLGVVVASAVTALAAGTQLAVRRVQPPAAWLVRANGTPASLMES